MRIQLFTLQYSSTLGGFDDTCIRDYLRDQCLLSFHEHFFTVHEVPHLLCVVTVQEQIVAPNHVAPNASSSSPLSDCAADSRSGAAMLDAPLSATERHDSRRGTSRAVQEMNLSERERILFNTLREWRWKKARDQGVPPYILFTNRQLAHIVRRLPDSLNALAQIDGVGPAKIKQYGTSVLACLHGRSTGTDPDVSRTAKDPSTPAPADIRAVPEVLAAVTCAAETPWATDPPASNVDSDPACNDRAAAIPIASTPASSSKS